MTLKNPPKFTTGANIKSIDLYDWEIRDGYKHKFLISNADHFALNGLIMGIFFHYPEWKDITFEVGDSIVSIV